MAEKSPAFQFYPQDFISDLNVNLMSLEEIGAYVMLMCHDWIEEGLPVDDDSLAALSRARERWPAMSERVLKCFKKNSTCFYSPRLKSERQKQKNFRRQKQAAGKASGKARKERKLGVENKANGCSVGVDISLKQKANKIEPFILHTSSSITTPPKSPKGTENEGGDFKIFMDKLITRWPSVLNAFPVLSEKGISDPAEVQLLLEQANRDGFRLAETLAYFLESLKKEGTIDPVKSALWKSRNKVNYLNGTLGRLRSALEPQKAAEPVYREIEGTCCECGKNFTFAVSGTVAPEKTCSACRLALAKKQWAKEGVEI